MRFSLLIFALVSIFSAVYAQFWQAILNNLQERPLVLVFHNHFFNENLKSRWPGRSLFHRTPKPWNGRLRTWENDAKPGNYIPFFPGRIVNQYNPGNIYVDKVPLEKPALPIAVDDQREIGNTGIIDPIPAIPEPSVPTIPEPANNEEGSGSLDPILNDIIRIIENPAVASGAQTPLVPQVTETFLNPIEGGGEPANSGSSFPSSGESLPTTGNQDAVLRVELPIDPVIPEISLNGGSSGASVPALGESELETGNPVIVPGSEIPVNSEIPAEVPNEDVNAIPVPALGENKHENENEGGEGNAIPEGLLDVIQQVIENQGIIPGEKLPVVAENPYQPTNELPNSGYQSETPADSLANAGSSGSNLPVDAANLELVPIKSAGDLEVPVDNGIIKPVPSEEQTAIREGAEVASEGLPGTILAGSSNVVSSEISVNEGQQESGNPVSVSGGDKNVGSENLEALPSGQQNLPAQNDEPYTLPESPAGEVPSISSPESVPSEGQSGILKPTPEVPAIEVAGPAPSQDKPESANQEVIPGEEIQNGSANPEVPSIEQPSPNEPETESEQPNSHPEVSVEEGPAPIPQGEPENSNQEVIPGAEILPQTDSQKAEVPESTPNLGIPSIEQPNPNQAEVEGNQPNLNSEVPVEEVPQPAPEGQPENINQEVIPGGEVPADSANLDIPSAEQPNPNQVEAGGEQPNSNSEVPAEEVPSPAPQGQPENGNQEVVPGGEVPADSANLDIPSAEQPNPYQAEAEGERPNSNSEVPVEEVPSPAPQGQPENGNQVVIPGGEVPVDSANLDTPSAEQPNPNQAEAEGEQPNSNSEVPAEEVPSPAPQGQLENGNQEVVPGGEVPGDSANLDIPSVEQPNPNQAEAEGGQPNPNSEVPVEEVPSSAPQDQPENVNQEVIPGGKVPADSANLDIPSAEQPNPNQAEAEGEQPNSEVPVEEVSSPAPQGQRENGNHELIPEGEVPADSANLDIPSAEQSNPNQAEAEGEQPNPNSEVPVEEIPAPASQGQPENANQEVISEAERPVGSTNSEEPSAEQPNPDKGEAGSEEPNPNPEVPIEDVPVPATQGQLESGSQKAIPKAEVPENSANPDIPSVEQPNPNQAEVEAEPPNPSPEVPVEEVSGSENGNQEVIPEVEVPADSANPEVPSVEQSDTNQVEAESEHSIPNPIEVESAPAPQRQPEDGNQEGILEAEVPAGSANPEVPPVEPPNPNQVEKDGESSNQNPEVTVEEVPKPAPGNQLDSGNLEVIPGKEIAASSTNPELPSIEQPNSSQAEVEVEHSNPNTEVPVEGIRAPASQEHPENGNQEVILGEENSASSANPEVPSVEQPSSHQAEPDGEQPNPNTEVSTGEVPAPGPQGQPDNGNLEVTPEAESPANSAIPYVASVEQPNQAEEESKQLSSNPEVPVGAVPTPAPQGPPENSNQEVIPGEKSSAGSTNPEAPSVEQPKQNQLEPEGEQSSPSPEVPAEGVPAPTPQGQPDSGNQEGIPNENLPPSSVNPDLMPVEQPGSNQAGTESEQPNSNYKVPPEEMPIPAQEGKSENGNQEAIPGPEASDGSATSDKTPIAQPNSNQAETESGQLSLNPEVPVEDVPQGRPGSGNQKVIPEPEAPAIPANPQVVPTEQQNSNQNETPAAESSNGGSSGQIPGENQSGIETPAVSKSQEVPAGEISSTDSQGGNGSPSDAPDPDVQDSAIDEPIESGNNPNSETSPNDEKTVVEIPNNVNNPSPNQPARDENPAPIVPSVSTTIVTRTPPAVTSSRKVTPTIPKATTAKAKPSVKPPGKQDQKPEGGAWEGLFGHGSEEDSKERGWRPRWGHRRGPGWRHGWKHGWGPGWRHKRHGWGPMGRAWGYPFGK